MKILFQIFIIIGLSSTLYSQTGNNKQKYILQFEKGKSLIKAKKYQEAKSIFKDLLDKKDIDIVGCAIKSEISNQLGVSCYLMNKYFDAYVEWNERSLPLRLACKEVKPDRVAQTYYNIGYIFGEFGNNKKAIEYIEKGLEIIIKNNLLYNKDYAEWYLNLYFYSTKINDFNQAEGYAFKALEIIDSLGIKDSELGGKTYRKIGRNFINKEEFNLAKQYLDISFRIYLKNKSSDQLTLFSFYATLFTKMKNYNKSRLWSKKALNFIYKNKIKNKLTIADVYETYGLSYNNKPREALKQYFITKRLRELGKANNLSISQIYENIAGAYGRLNMLDSALYYIDLSLNKAHAFDTIKDLGIYEELRKNDFDKIPMSRKLQMKGKYLTRKFKHNKDVVLLLEAEKNFSTADSLVKVLRNEIIDKNSKELLGISLDTIYKYAIDNVYNLWQVTGDDMYKKRIYYYSGENKAVVYSELKEELNAVWELLDSIVRKKYLEVSDELKSNLYKKQYAILKKDTIAYRKLNVEYLSLTKKKENLIKQIKNNNPDFHRYLYESNQPANISEIQENLDEDNAVLEYYVDGSRMYIFSISKKDFFVERKEYNVNLDSLFDDFSIELSIFNNKEDLRDLSKEVYPVLFPKELKEFLDKNEITRLIVIRDKQMNKIVFAPLMKGDDYTKDYLIYKYSFSYAFNNKYIWDLNPVKDKKIFEFGGYATNYDKETLKDIANDTIFWESDIPPFLPPLEQSVTEVQLISKIFNSITWTEQESTLENFKSNANKSKVLHLSLHSLLASKNTEQNAMIFQKVQPNKDYILKSLDLIGLRLNNSLSVLSSCYTSDGKVISGEGMKSLARNFSLSGSPTIVASQWQAYEGQTTLVLLYFYENLKKGFSKDIALQKAQIKYLKNSTGIYLSPSNWANLILIGDTSFIEFEQEPFYKSNDFLIIIIIFSVIMFIFSFYMFLKKEYKYWKKKPF